MRYAMVEHLMIDHLGHRGDGIALAKGTIIYVPYTLAGERVLVEAIPDHPHRRRLLQIESASPDRIASFCDHFGVCGGCAIQHWRTESYQIWKRQLAIDALRQAGIDCQVHDLIDAHGKGRRRIIVHARRDPQNVRRVGFAIMNSHEVASIDRCPVLDPGLEGAFDVARAISATLDQIGKPLDIQITATDNGMDIDIRGSGQLASATMLRLSQLTSHHPIARLTRHSELVVMRETPILRIGRADVMLPPGSFLQPTAAGEETLAAQVISHCKGAKHIADLFCGVGPFSLRLAEHARIAAIDSDVAAVSALQKATTATRGLKPVNATVRDLFRRPLLHQELREFDAVVFDPPRQGAQAQTQQLAASQVPIIVAISCNVATFARDARILIDGGYRCEGVTPIDQFRHTPHVELIARFSR